MKNTFGHMLRETGIALERGGMYVQGDMAFREERKSSGIAAIDHSRFIDPN
jgi:hypothetical protein